MRIFDIVKIWWDADQPRRFLPGLPDGVAGLYTVLLGQLVFGEHDAMTQLLMAAYGNGLMANIQLVQAFHRRIERIEVGMKNDTQRITPKQEHLFLYSTGKSCVLALEIVGKKHLYRQKSLCRTNVCAYRTEEFAFDAEYS